MKIIPTYIKFLIQIALVSLLVMTMFRVVLYFLIANLWIGEVSHLRQDVFHSFFMGLRYDNVITAYILMLPFLVLGVASFITDNMRMFFQGVKYYLITVYLLVLFILCTDIPFYLQFSSRLSTAALLWFDDSNYMLGMIINDWSLLIYFIVFLILAGISFIYIRMLTKKYQIRLSATLVNSAEPKMIFKVVFFLVMGFAIILSARGRLSLKSPIKIGTAYFSNDQSLNNIALNPVFTFTHSWLADLNNKNKVELMDDKEAAELSSKYLSLACDDSTTLQFYDRWKLENGTEFLNRNIVIIIMESMGSFKMGNFNGPQNLTPNLNRIASKSLYFNNIYTAGIHTFNGIYSTLFSFPALYKQQPLEQYMDLPHLGIAEILKNKGYSTSYFTTHDPNFDNVSGFLKANAYQNIFSEYPKDWTLSSNGIPDHKMFDYSIQIMNNFSEREVPFFATFMTASDHRPFIIPDNIDFEPHSDLLENQIIEYADWSIGKFLEDASKQDWYPNTIFVFIADHGISMGHTYDMPLAFHHTPLIMHIPNQSQFHDTLNILGGQIDVAPTLLGLLNCSNENNTMGINLFTNKRPFMYFCADDKIGCLDKEYYLIMRADNIETLYKYENLETENYLDTFKLKVDSMKKYTYSMMQHTQNRMKQKLLPKKLNRK